MRRHCLSEGLGGGGCKGRVMRTSSTLLQFIGDVLQRRFFVQVCGDVVCFAFAEGVEFFAGLFACFGVARGDVDRCAVLDEAFGNHAADAFGTARDEHDFVLQVVSNIELQSGFV